jgi:hypothetical protein
MGKGVWGEVLCDSRGVAQKEVLLSAGDWAVRTNEARESLSVLPACIDRDSDASSCARTANPYSHDFPLPSRLVPRRDRCGGLSFPAS